MRLANASEDRMRGEELTWVAQIGLVPADNISRVRHVVCLLA